MKLYYDMLVPFMPIANINDKGEAVNSDSLIAGRQSMMELSEFQINGNLMSLYQSVVLACRYAGKDVADVILNIPDDMEIPNFTVSEFIDDAAKMLFKSSMNDKYPFDLNRFVSYVLSATHIIFVSIQQSKQNKPVEVNKDA